jgi:hypothetical protein
MTLAEARDSQAWVGCDDEHCAGVVGGGAFEDGGFEVDTGSAMVGAIGF